MPSVCVWVMLVTRYANLKSLPLASIRESLRRAMIVESFGTIYRPRGECCMQQRFTRRMFDTGRLRASDSRVRAQCAAAHRRRKHEPASPSNAIYSVYLLVRAPETFGVLVGWW
jgi:hypothetical protein